MSQTVGRAIEILEFCSQRPRSLQEIATHLGVHRSTASRIIHTLSDSGFVRADDQGRYGVGFRLAALAQSALEQFHLREMVHPHIQRLSERTGHTVQFAVEQGRRLVYVDKVEPEGAISLPTMVGGFVVLHTAGVSKAVLANLDDAARDEVLAHASFERYTERTITDRDEFVARLAEVRARGWAVDDGEFDVASNCIAAPVWDQNDKVAGAMSITSLRSQATLTELRAHIPVLLATTASVSLELGWQPRGPLPVEPARAEPEASPR